MKTVIINADDYAQNAAIDAAILELAARKRVTSASAMVLSPRWRSAAREISGAPVDVGLHIDFTSEFAAASGAGFALREIVTKSYRGKLSPDTVRTSVERQFDLFEAALGAPPAFIDGHQHVHQLPTVREAIFAALLTRYGSRANTVRLRVCRSLGARGLKPRIIEALGAKALLALAAKNGILTNTDFAGTYDFSLTADLPRLWRQWLCGIRGARPLIMCHPALHAEAHIVGSDPIAAARVREHRWLASEQFASLCAQVGVELSAWPRLVDA